VRRSDLPGGTVTFLFTDVEGSTRLLHELGAEGYAQALAEHRRVIREACGVQGGVEVDTQGDAFFFAFPTAPGALAAAFALTEALASGPIQVRVGLHTGAPLLTDEGYVGDDVHRAARIGASGHGGQVLVSAATAQLVERDGLRDLGEHRFKDLAAPERVYQLGDRDFPALKSLYRTNLPVPATRFLGRERELREVVGLLNPEGARLLTLTGPGGTGKTRLALQAAAEAAERFPDGLWWVPLAPVRDPALLLSVVAQTLEVHEEPGSRLADSLAAALAGKRALVLLDNVEHLLPHATDEIAALGPPPGCVALVTSRERLQVQGEQVYPVPTLEESDGIELFFARARALDPAFAADGAVAQLCARLDNLPLALELAAARTVVFSPGELLERLTHRLDLLKAGRHADPRQQTLRATIEWSYDLLDEEEQRLFRSVSVFVGGWTYEAAEEICDADPDTLQSLLDKTLIRRRDTDLGSRYWMLETIREYAAERLVNAGEADEAHQRHAAYFLGVAETKGVRETFELHFNELRGEHDNFRTALTTFRRTSDSIAELRLARSLARFWYRSGYLREGMACLEEALSDADNVSAAIACEAHAFASYIASALGDRDRTDFHAHAQLELARRRGGIEEIAKALFSLGGAAKDHGELGVARSYFEASLDAARESQYDDGVMHAHAQLADLALWEGNFDRAADLQRESIDLARAQGWSLGMAMGFVNLALARLSQARVADASTALQEAAEIATMHQFPLNLTSWLEAAAATVAAKDNERLAAKLLGAAAKIREDLGAEHDPFEAGVQRTVIQRLRAALSDDFERTWAEGAAMTQAEAVAAALEFLD
jgi:predicted ATPase/class 3 adenylate cyclase